MIQQELFNNNNNKVTTSTIVTTSIGNQQVRGSDLPDSSPLQDTTSDHGGYKLVTIHEKNVNQVFRLKQILPPTVLYIRANDELGDHLLRKLAEKNPTLNDMIQGLDLEVEPDAHIYYEVPVPETFTDDVERRKLKFLIREWFDKGLIYKSTYQRCMVTSVNQ